MQVYSFKIYMIERTAQELIGTMKMISGSVFMIRSDALRELGWSTSITEDWDLTLRLYLSGYKIAYTPLIQSPAEIPSTLRRLARQRMRWAEGHTFCVKKRFREVLRSRELNLREKLEFIYYAPYYLQSLFFVVGVLSWTMAGLFGEKPPFWTDSLGWGLMLANLFAIPSMNTTGLFIESKVREDASGVFYFFVLSLVLTPFQAFAAFKGLLESQEGGWVRTLKTGSITDRVLGIRIRRLFKWVLPKKEK